MKTANWTGIALCAFACGACGGDEEAPAAEDPAEHACEHVNETGTAVTATDARASAPPIEPSDTPYTVTLVPAKPSFLTITGGIDALLFTRAPGVVSGVFHEQDTTNLAAAPVPNEKCPSEIPEHFDLALDQGGSYYVELAPAATASVWLALTLAGDHGGH